ncbi:hypothetical protein H5T51_04700 [Candidatus Bathyarchaeota archaeon]|nr:hypothetical protein [Candidatus Bathyarchaeota archaeon]
MKALEITPLEGKKLRVIIVEKEYNEPFWVSVPTSKEPASASKAKPSIAFQEFLKKLIDEVKPDYVTEEIGNRSEKEFEEENVIAKIAKEKNVPFFAADMDENAKSYIASLIDEKKQLRDQILKTIEALPDEENIKKEYLAAYGQTLQEEIEELERQVKFSVRESWITMGIMEPAKNIEKEEVTCIHVSSPEHVEGVKKLLESVDVDVESVHPVKKLILTNEKPSTAEIEDLLNSMQIQIKPVIKKTSAEAPYILFFLDTSERASPFDICQAYDAGFNVVVPYENVTPEEAKKIVQDAIFSRDPKGVKRTCFFVGGKDMEKAEEVLKVVKESMFPPFQTNVIIDPAGAYTTATAMVAKVEDGMAKAKLGELKGKKVAIFGTGAVGRVAAILLAKMGCKVAIVSPNPDRKNGDEYIAKIANLLKEKYGVEVEGIFAPTPEKKAEIVKEFDVILCASVAGARIITKDMLNEVKFMKVIADVNAVPPLGVEGMKLNDDMREIAPGIYGIGALAIGRLKYKLEQEILKEARRTTKAKVYSYNYAMELARKILKGELSPARLTVTVAYHSKEKK